MLEIDLERPRERVALSKSDQFNYYRQQVLSFLYEKKGVVDFDEAKEAKKEAVKKNLVDSDETIDKTRTSA